MDLKIKRKKLPYLLRVLVAIDQFVNVLILNGYEDHTISGRVGYYSYTTGKWYWRWPETVINILFYFEPDHCYKNIEWDEYGLDKPLVKLTPK